MSPMNEASEADPQETPSHLNLADPKETPSPLNLADPKEILSTLNFPSLLVVQKRR
ncbi:MAG: hypothetical protein JWO59_3035 [Chloroflexi bacterium]|nr:hypothetical protein [Chloroflexota bacterium]